MTKSGEVYVITNGAFSDSGFPKLYGQHSDLITTTEELTNAFCEEMTQKGLVFHRGYHWTTDAGYVELEWRILNYTRKGSLCVEMEGVGLFTVAKFRNKRAAIYVISDSGYSDDWTLGWGEEVLGKSINRIIDAIAD